MLSHPAMSFRDWFGMSRKGGMGGGGGGGGGGGIIWMIVM